MRKILLIAALVIVVGGSLAWQMQEDGGYLLIAYRDYTIDMSLWVALLLLGVAFFVWRGLKAVWRWINEPGRGPFGWYTSRDRGRMQTALGMMQFSEGRWDQASKTLKKSIKRSDTPLINCLTAASAAYEAGDFEEARQLLIRADGLTTGSHLAIELLRAKVYLREGRNQEAIAILVSLHGAQRDHSEILRLLSEAYRTTGDWQALENMLPDLRRVKPLTVQEMAALEVDIYEQRLSAVAKSKIAAELLSLWEIMPSHVRRSRRIVESYVNGLHRVGESPRAESLLRKILNTEWDSGLVRLYGIVEGTDATKQLTKAESWLPNHPEDANLLLTLGRLCQRNKLWGKARDYLESSLSLEQQPEVYGELARLMEQLGEKEKSAQYYQRGLMHYSGTH